MASESTACFGFMRADSGGHFRTHLRPELRLPAGCCHPDCWPVQVGLTARGFQSFQRRCPASSMLLSLTWAASQCYMLRNGFGQLCMGWTSAGKSTQPAPATAPPIRDAWAWRHHVSDQGCSRAAAREGTLMRNDICCYVRHGGGGDNLKRGGAAVGRCGCAEVGVVWDVKWRYSAYPLAFGSIPVFP